MKKTILILCCALYSLTTWAQWISNPDENYLAWPAGVDVYGEDIAISEDGTTWLVLYQPSQGGVTVSVQAIDSTGVKFFDEDGILVSDHRSRTWTAVNDYVLVDRDGNAIVVVMDLRNSAADLDMVSYNVYKISPEGEFLWGEDGIAIDGGIANDQNACMRIVQLEDGSYVFTWMRSYGSIEHFAIEMQRLDKDGNLLWDADETRLVDNTVTYQWPWLVNAGNNQCILVYAKGSNQDLYARKVDFDGTPVWAEDTRIYRGGWGGIPIHTLVDVQPANGGVVVSWNDDRYYTNIESAYMSYVKPNGELGFTAGEEGQKLGYEGLRSFTVKSKYDAKTNSFVALWRESSEGQSWYRMVAQRVSITGELLWGENGLEIEPLDQLNMAYNSVQNGRAGEIALFYMVKDGGVKNCAALLDIETGNYIWDDGRFYFNTQVNEKVNLQSLPITNDSFFITKWEENLTSFEKLVCMQRINYDQSLGNSAVERITTDEHQFGILSTIVDGETYFSVEGSGEKATLAIYDMQGRLVETVFTGTLAQGTQYVEWNASDLTAGVYLATLTTMGKVETIKVLIK